MVTTTKIESIPLWILDKLNKKFIEMPSQGSYQYYEIGLWRLDKLYISFETVHIALQLWPTMRESKVAIVLSRPKWPLRSLLCILRIFFFLKEDIRMQSWLTRKRKPFLICIPSVEKWYLYHAQMSWKSTSLNTSSSTIQNQPPQLEGWLVTVAFDCGHPQPCWIAHSCVLMTNMKYCKYKSHMACIQTWVCF